MPLVRIGLLAPSQRSRPTACGPSGWRFDIPYLWSEGRRFNSQKDQLQKGLEWFWDTSSWFLSPTLVPWSKVSCMTANDVSLARFALKVGKMGLLWKTSLLGPFDAVSFHGHSYRRQPLNIYTRNWVKSRKSKVLYLIKVDFLFHRTGKGIALDLLQSGLLKLVSIF